MANDERARQHMFQKLDEALGPEAAGTMMEHLPPVPWNELATKQDIAQLATATKQDLAREIAQLATSTKYEFAQLATEIQQVEERMSLRQERSEERLLAAFRGELITAVTAQTRPMLLALVATVVSVGGFMLAAG